MNATSQKLNIPLRTEIQAKCQILPKRFKDWNNFEVRCVFYDKTGNGFTRSFSLDDLYRPWNNVDAYGVYGDDPSNDGDQMHISDSPSCVDACRLKLALEAYPS